MYIAYTLRMSSFNLIQSWHLHVFSLYHLVIASPFTHMHRIITWLPPSHPYISSGCVMQSVVPWQPHRAEYIFKASLRSDLKTFWITRNLNAWPIPISHFSADSLTGSEKIKLVCWRKSIWISLWIEIYLQNVTTTTSTKRTLLKMRQMSNSWSTFLHD